MNTSPLKTILLLACFWLVLIVTGSSLQVLHGANAEQANDANDIMIEYLSLELSGQLNEEIQTAIAQTLRQRESSRLPGSILTITALRLETGWGLATVVSTRSPEYQHLAGHDHEHDHDHDHDHFGLLQPGFTDALLFAETETGWEAALAETASFEYLLTYVPEDELSQQARAAFMNRADGPSSPANPDLKFPWRFNEIWRLTQGWHCDYYGCDAIDFAPDGFTTRDVLSVTDAVVTGLCDPGGNVQVQVRTRSTVGNQDWYYLHLAKNDPYPGIGQLLSQGDIVGKIYWAYNYSDGCGYGSGPHLHLTAPSRNFTMDSWTAHPNNIWTRPGYPDKTVGDTFESTNGFSGSDCCGCGLINQGGGNTAVFPFTPADSCQQTQPLLDLFSTPQLQPFDIDESDELRQALDQIGTEKLAAAAVLETADDAAAPLLFDDMPPVEWLPGNEGEARSRIGTAVAITPPSSNSYTLAVSVMGLGGGQQSAGSYTVFSTIGQAYDTPLLHSQSYHLYPGFESIVSDAALPTPDHSLYLPMVTRP